MMTLNQMISETVKMTEESTDFAFDPAEFLLSLYRAQIDSIELTLTGVDTEQATQTDYLIEMLRAI